ncbi:MAG: signal peptide peptidase SppA [Desulfococcaceae bacterium]
MKKQSPFLVAAAALLLAACSPTFKLFPDARDPLREFTLEGQGDAKVLVLLVDGTLTDKAKRELVRTRSDTVRRVVTHLKKAEKDSNVRAVLLKINTPGGTVTASDLLYHEIKGFRERTGRPVVAAMMNMATSGGYYISLPADRIVAHPTTLTGSIGVVFFRPNAHSLLERAGVEINAQKTGKYKDSGSPFRPNSEDEIAILQNLVEELGDRFHQLVREHRDISPEAMETIATARIFLAPEAKELGLVDKIGYLDDALDAARELADLPEDARVIIYRRTEYPDDTIYNSASTQGPVFSGTPVLNLSLPESLIPPEPGFHYIWHPGASAP